MVQIWDVVIVGAGVAGTALAHAQGQVKTPIRLGYSQCSF